MGNIVSGHELISRMGLEDVYGMMTHPAIKNKNL